jgi:hypothetical protein
MLVLALVGCATVVPRFDVPYYDNGAPSTATITREIECELYNLVRDDVPPDQQISTGRQYLLIITRLRCC